MIDHMGIPVSDLARSRAFYEAALGPLGMSVQMEVDGAMGFGVPGEKILWIGEGTPGDGLHVAFRADRHEQVDRFHEAALKAGRSDNGKPGPRPNYGADYYAAFVHDPDGVNVEAVCYGRS